MTKKIRSIVSLADGNEERQIAASLGDQLGLTVFRELPAEQGDEPMLQMDEEGLALRVGNLMLRGDFRRMLPRLKTANLRGELLVRAAKIKNTTEPLRAVDATAGLGEDALLLAATGFSVTLYENNPIIAALLKDALRRGAAIPELAPVIERMQLIEGDSIEALPHLDAAPTVILLDPMFPGRQKSGLVKKKFQLLHHLEQPCTDEAALLQAAMAAQPKKIIIKRPPKGPYLAGVKPGYSLTKKGIRIDCIVLP